MVEEWVRPIKNGVYIPPQGMDKIRLKYLDKNSVLLHLKNFNNQKIKKKYIRPIESKSSWSASFSSTRHRL